MFAWLRRLLRGGAAARKPVLLSDTPAIACEHELRAVLDERYLALRGAMAARDHAAILALLTPDFVSEDLDGNTMTGEAMANSVIALDIDRSKRTAETTLTSIVLDGDEAIVQQRYAMTTTESKPHLPQAVWTESRDRFRLVDGSWLFAATTTEAREIVKNGRRTFHRRLNRFDPSISIGLEGRAG